MRTHTYIYTHAHIYTYAHTTVKYDYIAISMAKIEDNNNTKYL